MAVRLQPATDKLRSTALRAWKASRRIRHHRRFRIAGIVLVALVVVGAWASLLIGKSVDLQDPRSVSDQFMADMTHARYNHAYQLMSERYRQTRDNRSFRSDSAPDITKRWPASQPVYRNSITVDDNSLQHIYLLPGDGNANTLQIIVQLARQSAGKPWAVDGIGSLPAR